MPESDRRSMILFQAAPLFAEKGINGCTVRGIAEEVGMLVRAIQGLSAGPSRRGHDPGLSRRLHGLTPVRFVSFGLAGQ